MNDSHRKGVSGADLFGPLIFTTASIIGVSVLIGLWKGVPEEGASGIGAVARAFILSVGFAPALLFAIGGAAVGARVFLRGDFDGVARDLSGILGTAAGLAILLGALSESSGGGLGAATGGALTTHLTGIVGGLVGLAAFLAPIWFTWVRDGLGNGGKSRQVDPLSVARTHGIGSTPETDGRGQGNGVSLEEAEALLPDSEEMEAAEAESISKPQVEAALAGGVPDWALKNESSNPYPQDPRLVGEIPVGAKPLGDSDAESAEASNEPDPFADGSTVQRWTPGGGASALDAPDGDLAEVAAREQAVVEPSLVESTAAAPEDVLAETEAKLASSEPETSTQGVEVLTVDRSAPRPSWETETRQVDKQEDSATVEDAAKPQGEAATSESGTSSTLWKPAGLRDAVQPAPVEAPEEDSEEDSDLPEVSVVAEGETQDDDEWEYEEVEDDDEELEAAGETDEDVAELPEAAEEEEALEAADGEELEGAESEDEEEYEYVEVDEDGEELEATEEDEDGDEELEAAEEDEEELEASGDEYELVEVDEAEEAPGEEAIDLEAAEDDEEYEYVEVDEDGEEVEAAEDEELEAAEDDEEYEYVEVDENGEETVVDGDEVEAAEDDEDEYEYVEVDENGDEIEASEEEDDEEYEYVEVDENGEEIVAAEGEDDSETEEAEEPESVEVQAEEPASAEVEVPEVVAQEAEEVLEAPEATEEVEPVMPPESAEDSEADVDELDANGETQMDLFGEPAAELEEAQEEPVVIIEPQPSPSLRATEDARKAADLILSESRVAVSLLQRSFGLDFKQSCAILDELQELGFIGPYIDGKQRDILMDREEWLCAVESE